MKVTGGTASCLVMGSSIPRDPFSIMTMIFEQQEREGEEEDEDE